METILFIIALVAIFAVKAFAIVKWHDDDIDNSRAFSWTKPGMKQAVMASEAAVEQPAQAATSTAWSPTLAGSQLHAGHLTMRAAH